MIGFAVLDPVATGNRIRELRLEKHLRVEDIRDYLGFECSQSIYKWQRGESLPTVDNLFALSRLLGTPVDDILIGRIEGDEKSSSFLLISRAYACMPYMYKP